MKHSMLIFNTLTGAKQPFSPSDPQCARIYVCGPTVYDYAHLGHARAYIVYDVLVRHLRAAGQKVKYVRNVTDIDDKIIRRAKEANERPEALAARFTEYFQEDMGMLGNLAPDVEPKVSEHLEAIQKLILELIQKGAAYEVNGDVYFSVRSFDEYGKLSKRSLESLLSGGSGRLSDEETARKRDSLDFALWKKSEVGETGWPSPWGSGRPGWHIECSAMSMAHLGESFDLHGGGLDLVFPHHENEIAQSEKATGKPYATIWMHNGFVEVDKEKMSKSLGNFFTIRELFRLHAPEAIRYALLSAHYRAPINLEWRQSPEGHVEGFPQLEEAERSVEYIYMTRARLLKFDSQHLTDAPAPKESLTAFDLSKGLHEALEDDLNMPIALSKLHEFLKATNDACDRADKQKGPAKGTMSRGVFGAIQRGFSSLGAQLGLGEQDATQWLLDLRARRAAKKGIDPNIVSAKIKARQDARELRDFALADALRSELTSMGVELMDSAGLTTWRVLG